MHAVSLYSALCKRAPQRPDPGAQAPFNIKANGPLEAENDAFLVFHICDIILWFIITTCIILNYANSNMNDYEYFLTLIFQKAALRQSTFHPPTHP